MAAALPEELVERAPLFVPFGIDDEGVFFGRNAASRLCSVLRPFGGGKDPPRQPAKTDRPVVQPAKIMVGAYHTAIQNILQVFRFGLNQPALSELLESILFESPLAAL